MTGWSRAGSWKQWVCLGLILFTGNGFAQDAEIPSQGPTQGKTLALEWLERMVMAPRQQNYEGVFIYARNDQISAVHILHSVDGGRERERLRHLDGPAMEVLRDGNQVECVHPDNYVVRIERSIPAGPFSKIFIQDMMALENHYVVALSGPDRVADRAVMRLTLMPRDEYRYRHKLWVDQETALLLKSVIQDAEGRNLESFQFTSLEIGSQIDPRSLEPRSHGQLVVPDVGSSDLTESRGYQSAWRAGWLPDGFRQSGNDIRRSPRIELSGDQLMFTDGLTSFSVFVEPAGVTARQKTADWSRLGSTIAYSTQVSRDQLVHHVTVVGEIPLETARRVAGAMKTSKP